MNQTRQFIYDYVRCGAYKLSMQTEQLKKSLQRWFTTAIAYDNQLPL